MRIVFFVPPLRKLSGGLANIYAVARHLRDLGHAVALMGPSADAAGFASQAVEGLTALPWGTPLLPTDIWCIPEGWPNAIAVGSRTGCRIVVYVQNWVYMLGTLPEGVRWRDLPLSYIAVSEPLAWFLRQVQGVAVAGLLPAAVPPCFYSRTTKPADRVRVAWMPRKNRALGEQMRGVAEACLAGRPDAPRVEWVEIHNLPRERVATVLAASHLFLSTGFPEGFALPPLEAMASGCVPLGFTGFGGWEYMRQARVAGLFSSHAPPFAWEGESAGGAGNGFFFADGDTLGAGMALAEAVCLAHADGQAWRDLTACCRATAARYSEAEQKRRVADIFPGALE